MVKKLLTGAFAICLATAPVMGVAAAPTTVTESTETVVDRVVSESTSGAVATIAEVPSSSSVAGVKSTVGGVYLATSVNGSVITTSISAIMEGYGLSGSDKPYAKFSNMDPKKSYLAKQAIDFAAASQGAEVGPMINIELGKMAGGKYSLLSSEGPAIRLSLGIPAKFADAGKTYAMVCVREGGVVSILKDVDTDPNTITFDTTGGAGVYAIIRY